MKRINAHGRIREYVYVALFLLVFAAVLTILYLMPQADIVRVSGTAGSYDLSGESFGDTTCMISKEAWESWPEKLYTPEELKEGGIADDARVLEGSEYKTLTHATHRLRLRLPAEGIYGLKLRSSDYSMRIFINGEEYDSVGAPGETRETTVPRVQNRVYYFYAEAGETELVVQAANFVHAADGAWPPDFHIGTQENITRQNTVGLALSFIIIGYLLTAFFDHLGLFCMNRKRKTTLVFSIACLLLALMDKNLIMTLIPEYNWFVAIRFEYIIHLLTFATLTLFLDMLYPKLLYKHVARAYYAVTGVFILLTLVTGTRVFTAVLQYFDYLSLVMIGYIFVRLAMNLKNGGIGGLLSFTGALILGLAGINDILYYQGVQLIHPIAGQFFLTPIGMTFFVFCNSMVVSVEYVDTEIALMNERLQVESLAADNVALDNVNQMRSDIISTISHESRTPLAVLAGYAGLVSMELKAKGVDERIAADLDTIAFEAERVAGLIDGMSKLSRQEEQVKKQTVLDIGELVRQTTRLYAPIVERGDISLITDIPHGNLEVFGSAEELTQVIFNLLQNAKNHTERGNISAAAAKESGWISVTITDTGTGIDPALLPRVFERGTRGEKGGSGIGLALCKEIAERHGGTISLTSEPGKGTTVTLLLPEHIEHKDGDGHE